MTLIKTASGRNRRVPAHVDIDTVLGLDAEGRVVVQEDWMAAGSSPYAFGLTLCCTAWDKGVEGGVVCRACFGGKRNADAGSYLFADDDGNYPGLDPLAELKVPH